MSTPQIAIHAGHAPPRVKASSYPVEFVTRLAGREKRPLGDVFGLRNFGVNLTRLLPGARSALRHGHSLQDEFLFLLVGSCARCCLEIGCLHINYLVVGMSDRPVVFLIGNYGMDG